MQYNYKIYTRHGLLSVTIIYYMNIVFMTFYYYVVINILLCYKQERLISL